jgi:hypothetical protein
MTIYPKKNGIVQHFFEYNRRSSLMQRKIRFQSIWYMTHGLNIIFNYEN